MPSDWVNVCCTREYLLYVCASGSMASPFFIHMALMDWAACFCLADNFLGALVKVTPSNTKCLFYTHQAGLWCKCLSTHSFLFWICSGLIKPLCGTCLQW